MYKHNCKNAGNIFYDLKKKRILYFLYKKGKCQHGIHVFPLFLKFV